MQKKGSDTLIALIAISAIGSVARAYFKIGQPIVQQEVPTELVEKIVKSVTNAVTEATSET